MKKIVILGATGSIGTQTLDVVRRLPEKLRVVGLSAYQNETLLREQAAEFGIPEKWLTWGIQADLVGLAQHPDADLIVVAVAGVVGLEATLMALKAGKDVALATKEVLVAAGQLVMASARENHCRILPIDSEHSAIFQCLQQQPKEQVARLLLTASGGPFRKWSAEQMAAATVTDALNHPTWPSMGRKITIDSATLMNKALEMIEAQWLFDMPLDQVTVVIHPQSVVHSLVEFCDGSVLAQMGLPDMRVPIEYALLSPERADMKLPRFDLTHLEGGLTFSAPEESRFPSLALARRAASAGGTMPAVMNAANEAAVGFFLNKLLMFPAIVALTERVMDSHKAIDQPALAQIIEADSWARNKTQELILRDRSHA